MKVKHLLLVLLAILFLALVVVYVSSFKRDHQLQPSWYVVKEVRVTVPPQIITVMVTPTATATPSATPKLFRPGVKSLPVVPTY